MNTLEQLATAKHAKRKATEARDARLERNADNLQRIADALETIARAKGFSAPRLFAREREVG